MKINLILLFIPMLFIGCNTTQPTTTTVTTTTTQVSEQKKLKPWDAIIGRWKMESYQVFSPDPDPTESQEIIWEFKNKREFTIMNSESKTTSMNTGRYWMNRSIINVNGTLYMYSFEDPYNGPNPKPYGEELWLDSNIDPSISNDGPKIYFSKM